MKTCPLQSKLFLPHSVMFMMLYHQTPGKSQTTLAVLSEVRSKSLQPTILIIGPRCVWSPDFLHQQH